MNAINPNNSNNLTSGFGHSNDMNFVKSSENRLGDSNSLSSVELAQLPMNPMYTDGSTAETDVLKANYGIPADECWLFKPPKQHQTQGSVEPIRTWLQFKDKQTAVEDTYRQMRKLCENYKLFAKPDDLDELYSTSLNLRYIQDDYETIKHELSVIKANRQIARDALLAAGFQCPDDPPT
ncbi:unnamed protein product [Schistosoma mattheei]|uniref:Uncharacterized protein n=1 Tax=Schistosoma mattheei TaxID=31246 RepID=A0A183PJT1_9TREM|nr:unnamed protein product [Schistosoma mattheei]